MQEIGPFGADGADDVAGEPRRDVDPAPDTTVRDVELIEPLVEQRRVGAGHVEPEKARVDASLTERRQQCEQVSLRTADAGELVEMEDLHLRLRSYTLSRSSAMREVAKRTRMSAAPAAPSCARSAGSLASSTRRRASPSMSPTSSR